MSVRWKRDVLAAARAERLVMVQLIEQWSMMEWSVPAMPMPSRVTPAPGRTRTCRMMMSFAPLMPNGAARMQMPLPGAVWPAIVR